MSEFKKKKLINEERDDIYFEKFDFSLPIIENMKAVDKGFRIRFQRDDGLKVPAKLQDFIKFRMKYGPVEKNSIAIFSRPKIVEKMIAIDAIFKWLNKFLNNGNQRLVSFIIQDNARDILFISYLTEFVQRDYLRKTMKLFYKDTVDNIYKEVTASTFKSKIKCNRFIAVKATPLDFL